MPDRDPQPWLEQQCCFKKPDGKRCEARGVAPKGAWFGCDECLEYLEECLNEVAAKAHARHTNMMRWDHSGGRVSFLGDFQWLRSLDACQRDLLPDLERRGIAARFVMHLVELTESADGAEILAVLKASPRQYCEAYAEAIETS